MIKHFIWATSMDVVWTSMSKEPYPRDEWDFFTQSLDELVKGKPYTKAMMDELNDPRLKAWLLEYICKRAI